MSQLERILRVVSDDADLWQWAVNFGPARILVAGCPWRRFELPDCRSADWIQCRADEGKDLSYAAGQNLAVSLVMQELHFAMPDLPDWDVAS